MKIYLLRHGETYGNVEGLYAGFTDTKLTEKGIAQAKEAHQRLKGESFDVVIASSLTRAMDTAGYVTDLDIIAMDSLKEMNFGICEGLTYLEILKEYPDVAKAFEGDFSSFVFPEGESLQLFYKRIVEAYQKLLKTYDRDLLIVAHSGVIRSILAHEISENFDHYWKYRIDNCRYAILEYRDDYVTLNGLNL